MRGVVAVMLEQESPGKNQTVHLIKIMEKKSVIQKQLKPQHLISLKKEKQFALHVCRSHKSCQQTPLCQPVLKVEAKPLLCLQIVFV